MSFNGSGTFQINSSGQPVVTGTVISSTAFNALTADLATGLSTCVTKDGQTTTTARILFAQGISSTLVTDATSATTGSIITAGGISTQKALWVGTTSRHVGATQFDAAITYGGVTLSNAVTGTGNMVLSASPTLTGTLTAATGTFSGTVTAGNGVNSTSLSQGFQLNGSVVLDYSSGPVRLRDLGGGINLLATAATDINAIVGATTIGTFASTGLAVTGTLSATGAVTGTRFTPSATGNNGLGLAGVGSPGIYVNGTTEAARFDTSGRFLVATTSLVNGNSKQSIWVTAGNNALETNSTTTAAYNPCLFYNNSSAAGYISVSGATTAYNTSSDARMKTNVADAASASELIDAIKVRQFDWKVDGNHQRYGMIAQELLEVAPEAVSVPTDPEDMMGVDYSKLVPMLVKEIQSLRTRLAALENK